MDAKDREIALLEYQLLSQDLQSTFNEAPITERWLIVSCGAFWSWLLSNYRSAGFDPFVVKALCFIPMVVSVLFLIRFVSYRYKQKIIGKYRTLLEDQLFVSNEKGWESFLRLEKQRSFKLYSYIFWLLTIVGNGLFAWVIICSM
ncbi:hypothetical protein AB3T62_004605 [Vibrio parahaemolyticus]